MTRPSRQGTDSLVFDLDLCSDPFEEGGSRLGPLLDALEAHAGEWMAEVVKTGKRKNKYSRAAVLESIKDDAAEDNLPFLALKRESPDVELDVFSMGAPRPYACCVSGQIWPFSLVEEPARAAEWSRRFIELFRAWGSHYPVTHGLVHVRSDSELSRYWENRPEEGPGQFPREWLKAIFWLNVLGKEWVDGLGRARVLSTPAHLVEELPTGAVLIVTRPTIADWRSEEARVAQAKAFAHLRPDLDFDTVLRELRERSAMLAPMEPRFEPDSAPLFHRVVNHVSAAERPRKIAELNAFRPAEVEEWLPADAAPRSDVADPAAVCRDYNGMGDDLSILLHPDVPAIFKATPESLTDIDYRVWWEKFPEFYQREKIDQRLFPCLGAYLGEVLVQHLGGRWVPRRNLEEAQVVIGDRAWLPFVRVRRYLQSTASLLDYSLTKFYREAERHARARPNPT